MAFQNPFADGELIYTTFKKPVKRIVFKQQGFITDSKDKQYHPTQKPTELVQDEDGIWCILNPGWVHGVDETQTIHCETYKELRAELPDIKRLSTLN